MDDNIDSLFFIVKESVSLFVLLLVLVGGYRLLNRLFDTFDSHLGKLEGSVTQAVELFEVYIRNNSK